MSLVRALVILPLAAAVVLTSAGCKPRGSKGDEPADRASSSLQAENQELRARLTQAQEELEKNQGGTVGASAGLNIGEVEGLTPVGGGRVALGEDFAFEKGSATLTKDGKKAIEKLALKLNDGDHAGHLVVVEGHTDDAPVSRPRTVELFGDNWGLSAARAAAVVRALQGAGISPSRLRGAFRGQYAPAVATGKKDDRAANRRVEIYLSK